MSSITASYVDSAEQYIETNWVKPKDAGIFKRQCLSRVCHLGLVPLSGAAGLVDMIAEGFFGLVNLVTAGKNGWSGRKVQRSFLTSGAILAKPYANLLKAVNPKAKIENDWGGVCFSFLIPRLDRLAQGCSDSPNKFMHHVASRLTYVLAAISSVVARIIDVIIAVFAVILSFATVGKKEGINTCAYQGLRITAVINDVFNFATKVINPWAGK